MAYTQTGGCPKCGAPIYEQRTSVLDVPAVHFTCECRLTLPQALPDVDGEALETTEQADRKHLARTREAEEAASEERVDDRH